MPLKARFPVKKIVKATVGRTVAPNRTAVQTRRMLVERKMKTIIRPGKAKVVSVKSEPYALGKGQWNRRASK